MPIPYENIITLDELTVFKNLADQKYATQTTTSGLDTRISALEAEGADDNTIETVKVNGTALVPDANKAVDVTVPTKFSDLTADGDVVVDANYVHTDTNYTAAEASKLAGIEGGAQVNVLDGLTIGGVDATIVSKKIALGSAATASTASSVANDATLPTGAAVTTFVEGKGYQTATQVATAVEAYGYQDATDVAGIVEAYGYQTASDVNDAITAAGGQANVIETVKVNGTALTADSNKAVDVTITAGDSGVGTFKVNGTNVTAHGLGTAAGATVETTGIASNTDTLATTAQVKTYVDSSVSSVYKPSGSKAATDLTSTLLIAGNVGNVYNLSTALTVTDANKGLFTENVAGTYPAGTNFVVIEETTGVYKFDMMAGFIDLSGYVQASDISIATTAQINALFGISA